jgi:hypothetical protein
MVILGGWIIGTVLGVVISLLAFAVGYQVYKQDHPVPVALWGLVMFLIGLIAGVSVV